MRFATVEYKGKTFVGSVDKSSASVTPLVTRDGVPVTGAACGPRTVIIPCFNPLATNHQLIG